MSDLLQVADLERAKKHDTFHSEVITGKTGGLVGGTDIDYATNAVTGQVQKTLPTLMAEIDWSYVGLFADGVTFTKRSDFAVDAVGIQWVYVGTYPFTATAGTVPSEPLYQVVHVRDHNSFSNLNDVGGHDAIYRRAATVAQIKNGYFAVGSRLSVTDRGGEPFDVEPLGSYVITGFNVLDAGNGNVATLQRNEKGSYTPTAFGFPQDGVTDCAAAHAAYIASGISYFDWDAKTYSFASECNVLSGQHHNFSGTTLKAIGANKVLRAAYVDDWKVTGALTLSGTGDGSGEASENGTILFEVEDCKRYLCENITALDSLGKAFYLKGNSASRAEKGRWSNCYAYRCQKGWDLDANGATEYTAWSNCGAVSNFIGVRTGAGNMAWVGGVVTDNARNVELVAGDNHLHGTMTAVMINHATSENVLATDVEYGFAFNGCHFYGNGDGFSGRITLNNSQGVTFDGGELSCRVQVTTGAGTITGVNRVSNMLIAGAETSFQGDLSKLVSYGHIGLGSIDAKAFNRLQPINVPLSGGWTGALELEYSPASNEVRLVGTVNAGSGVIIAVIPQGFRPRLNPTFSVDANGAFGSVAVFGTTGGGANAGEVHLMVGSGSSVKLDSCSWQAWQ